MLVLPVRQNDGAQNGDQDQKRGELKRINEILENHGGKLTRGRESSRHISGSRVYRGERSRRARDGGGNEAHQRECQQNSREAGQLGLAGVLLDAGIQEHDDEDEEHHDGAAVDDDLDGGDKLRAHQQIQSGERDHDHDERKRAVNGMLLKNEADSADEGERGKHEENDQRGGHGLLRNRTKNAVRMTLTMETGKSSFQPKAIS